MTEKFLNHHLDRIVNDIVNISNRKIVADWFRHESSRQGRSEGWSSFKPVVIVNNMGSKLLLYNALVLETLLGR